MTKRMLIDATHAEETRVVVLDGNRLEDFDVETSTKRQLKGNIYLAKVVRVEPSLQAAFVEYGGNRHGFLAFSEIHPDYYQIPVADRERLLEMEEEEARREEEQAEAEFAESPVQNGEVAGEAAAEPEPAPESGENGDSDQDDRNLGRTQPLVIEPEVLSGPVEQTVSLEHEPDEHLPGLEPDFSQTPAPELWALPQWPRLTNEQPAETRPAAMEQVEATPVADHDPEEEHARGAELEIVPEAPPPETVGGDHDNGEDQRERRMPPRFLRNYKIQEVIKRRQILLVQVVKEERGTKGAALTTYISLAGRFCVLMPNSPRGGGISRKITSVSDRKRLKDVIAELDLPKGMGLIVRTAGANRPKPEIKRDCEYLLRLWDDIREHTLESIAPALIYEEASLIKRAIRDVYSRDIDEVLVDGDDGWKAARDFMRMLMPAHAKKVQLWRDNGQPLFAKYQVEAQLDGMLLPTVQLRSGGYLVINQAEALVAIDVNSGRSTRERNIEETALRTDLEAADEIARQLRLRDLAGLIVIDFIDMESKKHNSMVERRLKEALKNDRARIQVGHISHFGLLEMSRQRLRPSLAETSFIACPHCGGTGHVRSTESAAIHVLRGIEEEGSKRRAAEITVHVSTPVALYLLNHKRERLREIELRYDMRVVVAGDDTQIAPQFRIERVRAQTQETRQEAQPESAAQAVRPDARPQPKEAAETEQEAGEEEIEDQAEEAAEDPASEDTAADGAEDSADDPERRRRRRRRRRRGQRREEETGAEEQPLVADMPPPLDHAAAEQPAGPVSEAIAETRMEGVPEHGEATDANEDEEDGRGRRRGRRGGKRRRRDGTEAPSPYAEPGAEQPDLPPVYIGPTPANPFGGHAFDIFDVLEQAEQSGGTSSATAEQVIPHEAPADDRPLIHAEEAGSPDEGPVQMELAPPAEPPPLPEPSSETWVAELEPVGAHAAEAAEPVSEPAPVEPAPEEPAPAEPAIKPIVIGGEDEPPVAERKRGWWRR